MPVAASRKDVIGVAIETRTRPRVSKIRTTRAAARPTVRAGIPTPTDGAARTAKFVMLNVLSEAPNDNVFVVGRTCNSRCASHLLVSVAAGLARTTITALEWLEA